MKYTSGVCYQLDRFVVIEDFDNESLLFIPGERRLIKINSLARAVLQELDGKRNSEDITAVLASSYDVPIQSLKNDVKNLLDDLSQQGAIRDVNILKILQEINQMDDTRYSKNFDISCRIEDQEGAILFNPETDGVHAINPIGLAIWQALEYPRTKSEIVAHLMDVCEEVPVEQVSKDVEEFVEKLNVAGFVGKVLE